MKNLSVIIILFIATKTIGQIKFEKGYFINNNNEKIECFIKNIDWKDNPTSFEYKMNLIESKSLIGNITTVMEFSVEGENKYKRFEVNIEKSNDDLRYLKENRNPVWNKQSLFLKVLVEGNASLYGYSEDNIFKYFYNTKTIPTEQLICIKYKSSEINSDNVNSYSESIKTNNMFRQQLYNNVKNDSMSDKEFENIGYNANSLIDYFTKYNSQQGNSSTYTTKVKKGKVNIKITAGISHANLSIKDPNTYFNLSTDVSKMVYNFGAEFEYIIPFNKNKWALFINPSYQNFKVEKNYTNPDGFSPPHYINHKADIKYTSIELPIGVRYYMFLNENSKLFLSGMYTFNFGSESNITFDDDEQKKLEIIPRNNFAIGIGYTFKSRYSVELRTNLGREILGSYIQWSGKYNTIGIQFSYKFL